MQNCLICYNAFGYTRLIILAVYFLLLLWIEKQLKFLLITHIGGEYYESSFHVYFSDYETEKRSLENIQNQRMGILRRYNRDAHQARQWLDQNRHEFNSHIFGPIMLEVNLSCFCCSRFELCLEFSKF